MRKSLFNKAKLILEENRIILESQTDTAVFFKIIPSRLKNKGELLDEEYYKVSLFYEDYTLKHSCTCRNMSSSQPTNLCSHKIAAITKLTNA